MAADKFDLIIKSSIIKSEKPAKGVQAIESKNPHQSNRIIGFLPNGDQVCVAHRPSKGGIEFTKLMSGKIFAVAADGFSPVFDSIKDASGKSVKSKTQKMEDGLPLYSSSGFYSLSSKEYPAQEIFEAYVRLNATGQKALILPYSSVESPLLSDLQTIEDLEDFTKVLAQQLESAPNLVSKFDEGANKKRLRTIQAAQTLAEDNDEDYTGIEHSDLSVSNADGNPFFIIFVKVGASSAQYLMQLEKESVDSATNRTSVVYFTKEEAIANFTHSTFYSNLVSALEAESTAVHIAAVQGYLMRTSVSFKNSVEKFKGMQEWPKFGDAVFVKGAMSGWTKSIVTIMFSMHPAFPAKDYDSLHYVAALRQAEIGMNKLGTQGDHTQWSSPSAINYNIASVVFK